MKKRIVFFVLANLCASNVVSGANVGFIPQEVDSQRTGVAQENKDQKLKESLYQRMKKVIGVSAAIIGGAFIIRQVVKHRKSNSGTSGKNDSALQALTAEQKAELKDLREQIDTARREFKEINEKLKNPLPERPLLLELYQSIYPHVLNSVLESEREALENARKWETHEKQSALRSEVINLLARARMSESLYANYRAELGHLTDTNLETVLPDINLKRFDDLVKNSEMIITEQDIADLKRQSSALTAAKNQAENALEAYARQLRLHGEVAEQAAEAAAEAAEEE